MNLVVAEVSTLVWLLSFALVVAWLTQAWSMVGWLFVLFLMLRNLIGLSSAQKWLISGGRKWSLFLMGPMSELLYLTSKLLYKERDHTQKLLSRAKYFKQAAKAIPEGIIAIDQKQRIAWYNRHAMTLLNIGRRNRGRTVLTALRLPALTELFEQLSNNDSSNYHHIPTLEVPSPVHLGRTLSFELVPFLEGHQLLVVRDITIFKKMDTVRRDFIANASHELRTPLTVMQGYLEAMQDADDMKALRRWQKPILQMHNQTERMRKIVEDMLTLSTLEASQDKLVFTDVDVPLMLRQLVEEMRLFSGEHQHQLSLHLDSTSHLEGHEEYLRSAFTNLVTNAVRYTPDGGDIVLRWFECDDQLCFSVTDSGIGIDPLHLPRLSERFYRADNARSRETGGTGLGLSITKHVLERHHAKLTITSELSKGSCFTCHFPNDAHHSHPI